MRYVTAGLALATILITGCANQTSIWRNDPYEGNIVAMDAQQRVVISAKRSTPHQVTVTVNGKEEKQVVYENSVETCPEPSPDAIASFASSLGVGLSRITADSTQEARLQQAVATSVAAVGLRTPTTQVIRDLITANCIAQMNRHLDSPHFREAFARNQQFVLAAHAIAVIGGEAAAGQPTASGSAATAAKDPGAAYESLKEALEARQAAEAAVTKAQTAKTAAEATVTIAEMAVTKAEAASPTVSATIAQAKADLKSAQDDVKAKDTALKSAKGKVEDAQALEAAARSAAAATAAYTAASASGAAKGGEVSVPSKDKLSDKAVEKIAGITTMALVQGFTLDKCFAQLKSLNDLNLSNEQASQLRGSILAVCKGAAQEQEELQRNARTTREKLLSQ